MSIQVQKGDVWQDSMRTNYLYDVLHIADKGGKENVMFYCREGDDNQLESLEEFSQNKLLKRNGREVRRFDPEKVKDWKNDFIVIDGAANAFFAPSAEFSADQIELYQPYLDPYDMSKNYIYPYDAGKTFERPKEVELVEGRRYACSFISDDAICGAWMLYKDGRLRAKNSVGLEYSRLPEEVEIGDHLDWWQEEAVGKYFYYNPLGYGGQIRVVDKTIDRNSDIGKQLEAGEIPLYSNRSEVEKALKATAEENSETPTVKESLTVQTAEEYSVVECIQDQWPGKRVEMLERAKNRVLRFVVEGVSVPHVEAISHKGFAGYIFQQDNDFCIAYKPVKRWRGEVIFPVAVLFEKEG